PHYRDRAVRVDGDVVDRMQAADEIDAGGDHGRGMDQGADGSRTFHGVGQPGVKRQLRGLGNSTNKEQEGGQLQAAGVEEESIGTELSALAVGPWGKCSENVPKSN